jgi:hypothetical protein
LPPFQQQEVIDFVTFLEQRYVKKDSPHVEWTDEQFQAMSVEQAMRGLEDEPDIYSDDDLKERW